MRRALYSHELLTVAARSPCDTLRYCVLFTDGGTLVFRYVAQLWWRARAVRVVRRGWGALEFVGLLDCYDSLYSAGLL